MPLTLTLTARCFGSLLVISKTACADPFFVGAKVIITAIEPCGSTVNSPPLTGNGALIVGTVAASVVVPAFSICNVRAPERLPTATLPNLIVFALSFSLPPCGTGVAVGVADGVALTVGSRRQRHGRGGRHGRVALAVAVAVADGVTVAVAVAVAVAVGVATIPS